MFFDTKNHRLFSEEGAVEVMVKVDPSEEAGLSGDEAGVAEAIEESTEIWYNIREKMMRLEHAAIMKNKDGLVSEAYNLLEAGVHNFFDNISDLFRKMRMWLSEIWKKFVATILSWIASDKSFCNKYEKLLKSKNLAGFGKDLNVINWRLGDFSGPILLGMTKLIKDAEGYMTSVNAINSQTGVEELRTEIRSEEYVTALQNKLLPGSGGDQFKLKIKESFTTKGSLDKDSHPDININELISIVKDTNKNIKGARKAYKDIDYVLDKAQKFYKDLARTLKKATPGTGAINKTNYEVKRNDAKFGTSETKLNYNSDDEKSYKREAATLSAIGVKQISKICQQAFGVLISAIKERNRTYRSILAKAVSYKSEKNDSFNFSGSILDKF